MPRNPFPAVCLALLAVQAASALADSSASSYYLIRPYSGVDEAAFERHLQRALFGDEAPQLLRRNVRATTHRLARGGGDDDVHYIWSVEVELVGGEIGDGGWSELTTGVRDWLEPYAEFKAVGSGMRPPSEWPDEDEVGAVRKPLRLDSDFAKAVADLLPEPTDGGGITIAKRALLALGDGNRGWEISCPSARRGGGRSGRSGRSGRGGQPRPIRFRGCTARVLEAPPEGAERLALEEFLAMGAADGGSEGETVFTDKFAAALNGILPAKVSEEDEAEADGSHREAIVRGSDGAYRVTCATTTKMTRGGERTELGCAMRPAGEIAEDESAMTVTQFLHLASQ